MQEDDSLTKLDQHIYTIHAIVFLCLSFFPSPPHTFEYSIIILTPPPASKPPWLLSLSLSLPLGMASSAFEVLPALEADMEDISSIFTASFADDHILGPANSNVAPDLLRAADLEFTKRLWRTREAFNARFFKVVDRNTRSILFIFYIYIFLIF